MRTLSMIVALGLSAALATVATVAEAEFRFSARIDTGAGRVIVQNGDVFKGGTHRAGVLRATKRRERRGRHARHRSFDYPYYLRNDRSYRDERAEPAPPPADVAPTPPVAVTPVEPPPPPDPRGPVRLLARGGAPTAVPYNVGEPLPPGLPHVTLDWRQFELPEPPPGQLYARVGRDVLLITAAGRIVESVVPPG